jgi:hypothetical protein
MSTAERPRTPIDVNPLDLGGLLNRTVALANVLEEWSNLWTVQPGPAAIAAKLAAAREALAALWAELDRLSLPRGGLGDGDLTGEDTKRGAVGLVISSAERLHITGALQASPSWGPPSKYRDFRTAAALFRQVVPNKAAVCAEAREDTPRRGRRGGASINTRMIATIQRDETAMGWSCKQWAQHLGCAKSSVVETSTWQNLVMARERAKAGRAMDRRRRTADRRRR